MVSKQLDTKSPTNCPSTRGYCYGTFFPVRQIPNTIASDRNVGRTGSSERGTRDWAKRNMPTEAVATTKQVKIIAGYEGGVQGDEGGVSAATVREGERPHRAAGCLKRVFTALTFEAAP